MPPSHGLTGLAAIKAIAKSAMFSGPDQRRKPPCGRASNGFGTPEQSRRGPGHALAAFGNQPARTWQAEAGKQKKRPNAANVRKRKQAHPISSPVLLRFQEQIKGPENASIARFDGLRCYQTSSETSDVFRAGSMAKTDSQTGFKKVRCGFNAGRACTGCFRKPVCPDLAAESEARKAFKRRKHAKAQPSPSPVCFDFRSE